MPVVADPMPTLVTVPGVEILKVGMNWPLSKDGRENGTFTPEDLQSAVASQGDPAVRSPIVKVGTAHGPMKEPPAYGRLVNMRLDDEGMTLVADIAGVPAWLAAIMPSAWPSRSMECTRHAVTATGSEHLCRIDALALLSVNLPAIGTLAEVQAIWAAETWEEVAALGATLNAEAEAVHRAAADLRERGGVPTAATVTSSDVQRAYYDGPGSDWDWWIVEFMVDPQELIVQNDGDGKLYRVTYTLDGEAVTFGDPEPVRVEYVAAMQATFAAALAAADPRSESTRVSTTRATIFASKADSRPGGPPVPVPDSLRTALGLPADASEEAVYAAAEAAAMAAREASDSGGEGGGTSAPGTPATPSPTSAPGTPAPDASAAPAQPAGQAAAQPAGFRVPDGMLLVAAQDLETIRGQAAQGAEVARLTRQRDEDAFIAQAHASGRLRRSSEVDAQGNPVISPVEASLRREYQRDPVTAAQVVESMAQIAPVASPATPLGHTIGEPPGDAQWEKAEAGALPVVAEARNFAQRASGNGAK